MATVYHRDQAGAPALTYHGSTVGVWFTALKDILKACLVTGYGGKAAAGWELISEATSYLVMRNGTHSGYVCFGLLGSQAVVSLAATYSGVSGSIIQGDGAASGKAAGSTVPHKVSIQSLAAYAAASTWWLIADERTFLLGTTAANTGSDAELGSVVGSSYSCGVVYCGEDTGGWFICCGGQDSTSTAVAGTDRNFDAGGFTTLYNPTTGLLVDASAIAIATPGLWSSTAVPQTSLVNLDEVHLGPMSWVTGDYVGNFRGICADPRLMYTTSSAAARAIGLSATLTYRTGNTPIDLGDGNVYFVAPKYRSQAQTFLVTDNPRFW